ncbi:AI-2E family transporter [Rhodopseudomonas pseudopalustris]|uniref:AI-2E family transporter n=1 Tax=Rhodopseudomonas pseudopalustris TaxID=1513892 RepID=UPI003F96F278
MQSDTVGTPVPDSSTGIPPLIRRNEVISTAVVGLFVVVIIGSLYIAKPFFLPVITAFVVGTMLAPAAGLLEQHRVPRAFSAVLIVTLAFAVVTFMVTLIAAPVVDWSGRLPELGAKLKEKLQMFDGVIAMWRQMQTALGSPDHISAPIQFPTIEWMQPTYEFLSPTLTETLLFLVTLVLFIASWKDLRRGLVMNFTERDTRLRVLRILNEIEGSLGSYLLTVTVINFCYGIATGVICWLSGMPNPAALGALAAMLNFLPIIGPFVMFVILTLVGIVSFPTLGSGLMAPFGFALLTFVEGHFITPAIIGRRLSLNVLAVFITLAFWTWLWGPMGGFLAVPLLIVALVLKEHLLPDDAPNLPGGDEK